MAIDGSHPGCFSHGARLYAVPSGTGHSVADTRESYVAAAQVRRRRRVRVHWTGIVGAIGGGALIVLSAVHTAGLTDWLALAMMFTLGALVGFISATGIRDAFTGRTPDEPVLRLPAVEIPGDVARGAPVDATADELALWSLVTRRYRAARVAVENLPFESDRNLFVTGPTTVAAPAPTDALVLAELTYITAKHDFEPVAELLGLPRPA